MIFLKTYQPYIFFKILPPLLPHLFRCTQMSARMSFGQMLRTLSGSTPLVHVLLVAVMSTKEFQTNLRKVLQRLKVPTR